MIEMAEKRFASAMEPLFDSTGLPDVREVRARELRASSAFRYPWFERGYELTTVERRCRDRYYGIYKNSFSKHRSRFDELGRVSLSSHERK